MNLWIQQSPDFDILEIRTSASNISSPRVTQSGLKTKRNDFKINRKMKQRVSENLETQLILLCFWYIGKVRGEEKQCKNRRNPSARTFINPGAQGLHFGCLFAPRGLGFCCLFETWGTLCCLREPCGNHRVILRRLPDELRSALPPNGCPRSSRDVTWRPKAVPRRSQEEEKCQRNENCHTLILNDPTMV